MSMNGNHDYEYARSAVGAANADAAQEFNEAVRADALIHATLALAHEQRTANLIALAAWIERYGCKVHEDITTQIDERMGLA